MIFFLRMYEKTIKDALLKGERMTLECKRAKNHGDGSPDSFT